MKFSVIYILIVAIGLVTLSSSSSCSIEKRRYRKGLHIENRTTNNDEKIPENVKIQITAGAYRIIQAPATSQFFKDHFAPDLRFSIFIKRLFVAADLRSMTFSPKREFLFNDLMIDNSAEFNHNRFSLMCGYKFYIGNYLTLEPYIGYLFTDFRVINEADLNLNFGKAKVSGITAGYSINKLVPLGDDGYFVMYLNNNFNYAGYNKVSNGFGNYFFGISMGIGIRAGF